MPSAELGAELSDINIVDAHELIVQ